MQAIIKNFRGVADAEIAISPIALICGGNGQGKTSIARAIASAASGKAVPFDKLTKKDSGIMLRHGTKSGSVLLTTDDGSAGVTWPKGDVVTDGSPPVASAIAAGLVDFFAMKDDDKLAYLITLLKAEPTQQDFTKQMTAEGIDEKTALAIWKVIQEKDWTSAHKRAQSKGQELKGAWSQITGESFGSTKIETWFPADWHDSMADVDLTALDSRLAQLQKELETMIGKSAVSQAEHDRIKALVARIPQIEQDIATERANEETIKGELAEIEAELLAKPNPSAKKDYACPHCDEPVQITAVSGMGEYRLTKAATKAPSEATLKKLQKEHAELCGRQQNRNNARLDVKAKLIGLSAELEIANSSAKKLDAEPLQEASPAQIQVLRDRITKVETTKRLLTQHLEAKRTADQIRINLKIVALLDESGIRKTKLSQEIDSFTSDFIDPICADMGTPVVTLDADLSVVVGATPFQMLSAAEQFKARTAMQLAIARKEKASIVIVDGADIIVDGKSRSMLLQAISNCDFPGAVICMSMQKIEKAPDLQQMGVGTTYWVQAGKCHAISNERAAA